VPQFPVLIGGPLVDYAGEFTDAGLDGLADAGDHYLDQSTFFFMPTQNEMQEPAEIGKRQDVRLEPEQISALEVK